MAKQNPGDKASGLNVTTLFVGLPTAVQLFSSGQATLSRLPPPSLIVVGLPGAVGSNVTICPSLSTAVHCVVDGHARPSGELPASMLVGVGIPGLAGSKVTCCP